MSLQLPPIAPSAYQQALDAGLEAPTLTTETVRFWSDCNHVFYHPRSIVQLNEYELNSSLMPFEQWQKGEELFANLDREHDLLDRDLRLFLEECDQLQGIQIFSGTDDAWGGFASKYVERLADELGKGCRWVFGLQDTQRAAREQQMLRLANAAQSLYALDPSASLHVPLGSIPGSLPGYASIDGTSRWQTSALQATAVETMTLATRLRSAQHARATFNNMESVLNGNGMRRIAACSLSVDDVANLEKQNQPNGHHDPRMTNGVSEHDDDDDSDDDKHDIDMFPEMSPGTTSGRQSRGRVHLFSKIGSLRGPWKTPTEIHDASERLHDRFSAQAPRISLHQSGLLHPILPSYPSIFRIPGRPQKLAIDAVLTTNTAIASHVRAVENVARRMVGVEDREALCDGLSTIAEEYEDGWDSDDLSD